MKIGELARTVGIQPSAVRYYEERGLLPKAGRMGGKRVYGADAVDQLRFILGAQRAGLTLREIHALARAVRDPGRPAWRELVVGKLAELRNAELQIRATRRRLARSLSCMCEGNVANCSLVDDAR